MRPSIAHLPRCFRLPFLVMLTLLSANQATSQANVAYRMGPGAFSVSEVPAVLDRLLD
jgi:hypothetical protein